MDQSIKQQFEKLFRDLTSPDELFDTFRIALKNKIKDVELYKILLGNIVLSPYEIKMFTDKLCEEFEDLSFELYMWAANILENCGAKNNIEMAMEYYTKAIESDRMNHQPYLSIVKMYNPEIDVPHKDDLLKVLHDGLKKVKYKSNIYIALAEFYGIMNDLILKQKYTALAHKTARDENH